MARLVGPDEASREVKTIVKNVFRAKVNRPVKLWADAAATVPADVLTEAGAAVPDSTVTIDSFSMLPRIQFPDGVDLIYGTCDGGPAWPVYARTDDRLDAVKATADAAETPAGATAKAGAAQAAAIAAIAGTGPLRAVDGRNYRMVLGVIRNSGSGSGYWQAINDGAHRPHNIDSVSTDTSVITVGFSSLGGTRVVSFVAVPDETLAAAGITMGASVTATDAKISLFKPSALDDYVSYNGTSWVSTNGVFTVDSFTAGVLSLSHPPTSQLGVSVTSRGPGLVAMISGDSAGVHAGGLKVSWFDWAGTLQTVASTNMKAFITRTSPDRSVNPQIVDTATYPSSNIWIVGVVEV